jgi:hypothetical protein
MTRSTIPRAVNGPPMRPTSERPFRAAVTLLVVSGLFAVTARGTATTGGPIDRPGASPPRSQLTTEIEILQPVPSGTAFTGAGLAVSGDLLLIGVPGTTNGAAGAVYAYRLVGGLWLPLATPTLEHHGDATSNFGSAVAMSGTTAIVGAPNDGTGPGGEGSAWRYEFDGNAWDLGVEIVAPAGTPDAFGTSVAIDGDRVAIGAPHTGSNPTVDGGVVVFGPGGDETGTLIRASADRSASAVTTASDDLFGASVAISGDTLLVGAPSDDVSASEAGAAFALEADDDWTVRTAFRATSMFRMRFGTSVALAEGGLIAAIGAPEDGERAADNQGAVYVTARTATTESWPALDRLLAEDAATGSYFGHSVAIDAPRMVVGAPLSDGPVPNAGGAYLFELRGEEWTPTARLRMSGPTVVDDGARFGQRVALSGDRIAVASTEFGEPGATTGFVATFAPPFAAGTPCADDANCESGFCTDGVCCGARCDGACVACSATGVCGAADEGMTCTSVCGSGTCGAGVCSSADDCDAGAEADVGRLDGGGALPPTRRVSGCKCGVATRASSDVAVVAGLALALTLLGRARRRR